MVLPIVGLLFLLPCPGEGRLDLSDIVALVRSGVGDAEILRLLDARGTTYDGTSRSRAVVVRAGVSPEIVHALDERAPLPDDPLPGFRLYADEGRDLTFRYPPEFEVEPGPDELRVASSSKSDEPKVAVSIRRFDWRSAAGRTGAKDATLNELLDRRSKEILAEKKLESAGTFVLPAAGWLGLNAAFRTTSRTGYVHNVVWFSRGDSIVAVASTITGATAGPKYETACSRLSALLTSLAPGVTDERGWLRMREESARMRVLALLGDGTLAEPVVLDGKGAVVHAFPKGRIDKAAVAENGSLFAFNEGHDIRLFSKDGVALGRKALGQEDAEIVDLGFDPLGKTLQILTATRGRRQATALRTCERGFQGEPSRSNSDASALSVTPSGEAVDLAREFQGALPAAAEVRAVLRDGSAALILLRETLCVLEASGGARHEIARGPAAAGASCFSPDGRSVLFGAADRLRIVPRAGGLPIEIDLGGPVTRLAAFVAE